MNRTRSFIGMAFDPVFGSIEAVRFAAEAAGLDADLKAFFWSGYTQTQKLS